MAVTPLYGAGAEGGGSSRGRLPAGDTFPQIAALTLRGGTDSRRVKRQTRAAAIVPRVNRLWSVRNADTRHGYSHLSVGQTHFVHWRRFPKRDRGAGAGGTEGRRLCFDSMSFLGLSKSSTEFHETWSTRSRACHFERENQS